MPGPILTKINNWLFPAKPDVQPDVPPPVPPQPEPQPEPPVVTPSVIPAVNYLRALAILRKLPIAQLRAAFLRLPLRQICWIVGIVIWSYMTYAILMRVFVR